MQDTATIQCPYCGEVVEVYLEADLGGAMIQDCEVCCNPWQMHISHDEDGNVHVDVSRAQ